LFGSGSSGLGIPAIRDRVVQGALKLLLDPLCEADCRDGLYRDRPKRTAHQAIGRVAKAIVQNKTRVMDVDLAAFFDTVRHARLLAKVARRIQDPAILRLVTRMVKASGPVWGASRGCALPTASQHLSHGRR